MLNVLARPFVRFMDRWMPDPFIFAVLLSILTFLLAVSIGGLSPVGAVQAWGDDFWALLAFTTQIAMTLVTGFALAKTPLVHRALLAAAGAIRSPSAAYFFVALIGALGSLVSWGMGLVVGAVIARETAIVCRERGVIVHYPLLVAAAYSGFVVWHQGLSSSVALKVAEEGHFLQDRIGVIPVSETLFTSWNLTILVAVLVTLPVVMMLLKPRDEDCVPLTIDRDAEDDEDEVRDTPADRIGHSRILNLVVGAAGVTYLIYTLIVQGGGMDLNIVNFSFLIAGILLTRSPVHYIELVTEGGKTLGPIIIQYPFYAGIMGMMMGSGLAEMLSNWLASFATAQTLPVWAMISGGIVNIFVPSGGGQWAVQGPVMADAALLLDADMARVAMGVAIGDQWTNMIQPFWTIPALAIAGLHVRHIMGYCVIALFWTGMIFALGLLYL